MSAAKSTPGLSPPSAPAKDRPGKPMLARIAEILGIVAVLVTYGRHLVATLEQRAVARGFATIARFFGTVAFNTILAHLQRGLMRAIALEHVLLRRAARGRDLRIPTPRTASCYEPAADDAADPEPTAGPAPAETLTPEPDAAAQAAAVAQAAAQGTAGRRGGPRRRARRS